MQRYCSTADALLRVILVSFLAHICASTLPAGEIHGHLGLMGSRSLSDALVEAVDDRGTVVATTKTNLDGFYHFDLPPGQYQLRYHRSGEKQWLSGGETFQCAPDSSIRVGVQRVPAINPFSWKSIHDGSLVHRGYHLSTGELLLSTPQAVYQHLNYQWVPILRRGITNSFVETETGEVWIATNSGLFCNQYRGAEADIREGWKQVLSGPVYDSARYRDDLIVILREDGIAVGNLQRWRNVQLEHSGKRLNFRWLGSDGHGNVWGVADNQLYQIDLESDLAFPVRAIDSFTNASFSTPTKSGLYFCCETDKGVSVYRWFDSAWEQLAVVPELKLPRTQVVCSAIAADEEGTCWVAHSEGILCFRDNLVFPAMRNEEEFFESRCLVSVNDPTVSVVTGGVGGALALDDLSLPELGETHGLFSRAAYDVYIAKDQTVWVHGDQDVFSYKDDQIKRYPFGRRVRIQPGYATILQDNSGSVWAGNAEGLWRIEGDQVVSAGNETWLAAGEIRDLGLDDSGRFWFATNDGFAVQEGDQWKESSWNLPVDASLRSAWLMPDGDIWLTTLDTIYLYRDGELLNRTPSGSFGRRRYFSITKTENHGLLLGSSGSMLTLESDQWVLHERLHETLGVFSVRQIVETPDGRLWLLGARNQISVSDGYSKVHRKKPLPIGTSTRINRVDIGDDGTLWIATNRSVLRKREQTHQPQQFQLQYPDQDSDSEWIALDGQSDQNVSYRDYQRPLLLRTVATPPIIARERVGTQFIVLPGEVDEMPEPTDPRWSKSQLDSVASVRFETSGKHTIYVKSFTSDLIVSDVRRIEVDLQPTLTTIAATWSIAGALGVIVITILMYVLASRRARLGLEQELEQRSHELHAEVRQREATQEQLQHAQKMEAVGTLTGGIAHDFNNLLMGIIANLELSELEPGKSKLHVRSALQSSERAAALIRHLLGFSRKTTLRLVPTHVNEMIRSFREMSELTFDVRIEFRYQLASDLPPVDMDSLQMEQVLLNLCVNARDAMPQGGALNIQTQLVEGPPDHVSISVTDTGKGISPTELSQIFDPFFTTKPPGQGTGLGLSMCYAIVEQHNGRILCHSTSHGTEFQILLPVSTNRIESEPEQIEPTKMEPTERRQSILLVDDEKCIRDSTSRILRQLGYDVLSAENGSHALDQLRGEGSGVDIVLMDWTMPGMSGQETLKAIKSLRSDLPVVVCSGYTLACEPAAGDVTPDAMLQKPFRVRSLVETLDSVLGGFPSSL